MSDGREGFTMIEVLVAMVILGFALLSVQANVTNRLLSDVTVADHSTSANQLVQNRIDLIQSDPAYDALVARYDEAEDSVPGYPGFERETEVVRRTGYTVVTVRSVTPTGADTVAHTIVVGAP